MATNDAAFYQKLTRLFRSGPAIRRKIKGQDYKNYYDANVMQSANGYFAGMQNGGSTFKRENSPFSILGQYGLMERMGRYNEFAEMEYTTEIATALDIYADEACSGDENGKCLHIFSENPQIQKALEELFYEVYNINFEGRRDIRNLVKNGDFFRYVEVVPNHGVVHCEPIPVNEIEREEGYDPQDPLAVRYKLLTKGGKYLENWQVMHFRILANDLMLPYGTSFLECIRRTWRQLIMMEDAMLVYRVVRSPERRVYYVDVSAVPANDIGMYMEAVKEQIRGASVIDKITGRMDQRYNPVSVNDDIFLPTKPNSNTKIETLAGGQHVSATEDVEYIKSKLIGGLKVPKAYLGYDENLSSKATLAQEDIRFSRTVVGLQKIFIAELNKLAILHLYAIGFVGEDLLDFELRFSNPSTVAVQQKIALISQKLDAASKAWDLAKETGMMDMEYIQREILGFRPEQIIGMRIGAEQDQIRMARLKALLERKVKDDNDEQAMTDPFDSSNYGVPGSPIQNLPIDQKDSNGAPISQNGQGKQSKITLGSDGIAKKKIGNPQNVPIKSNPNANIERLKTQAKRSRQFTGNSALSIPDFAAMLSVNNRYAKDPYDMAFLSKSLNEEVIIERPNFTGNITNFPRGIERSIIQTMVRFAESNTIQYQSTDFNSQQATNKLSIDLISESDDESSMIIENEEAEQQAEEKDELINLQEEFANS